MDVEEKFVSMAALISEPTRARMLWNLLDGRAYTASELAIAADVSSTSASNHLSKLLEADILKVDVQGRHRYYSYSRDEVAYAVESLANLAGDQQVMKTAKPVKGVKFCRTCYDHLAGYVGVKIAEALVNQNYVKSIAQEYEVTDAGWLWATRLGIHRDELIQKRRPVIKQCLDWSERKPHIAGQFGAMMLDEMLRNKWFKKTQFSRELILTLKGKEMLEEYLSIVL
ncbi:ArsR/SmtB family transcription factor [Fulvivirga ligni]|uniref:ArsR/SmtB family transcription factor n=1 Tax=Fulvivirga ligni TaxID=2904246 RepID=UPI001F1FC5B8|nr:helix-turn-helix transcriptional regulator [Fulvivirga ligni]UII19862.1 ArsR family transcriptional regulator [Fulvivirga ligni]